MNPYSAYGINLGGASLGMQAPTSQLTPEQAAELQRARAGQQQSFTGNVGLQGATPPPPPGFRQQAREVYERGKSATQRTVAGATDKAQAFLKRYPNAGNYGIAAIGAASLIPGVTTALSELEAGRPTGAVGALAPGLLSAAGTGLAMAPHPLAKVAGFGLMGLGAILPGAGASALESARQDITGKPTKGKEADFSTQLAMRGQLTEQDLSVLNRELGVRTSNFKDLTQFYNEAQLQQYKAMAPELEKAKMNDFARYQSAMALQGNIQGQLGVLSTAGALAQQAQAGNYGLAQTALTNNPYTAATLQAPQIRFG